MSKLIQFNINAFNIPSTFPVLFNKETDWLPVAYLFKDSLPKSDNTARQKLSNLDRFINVENQNSYIKKSGRTQIDLVIYSYMWAELIKGQNVKILWSLMIHKNYIDYQKGSLLTTGKLIPEYTQLHVREEFARSSYISPTTRRCFIKKVKPLAEEDGIKIYEREDFSDVFERFSTKVDSLTELKQLKQYILNGLQEIE